MSKTISTAASTPGTVCNAAKAPENAGKGAAIAKSPATASNVTDEKKDPTESPKMTLSESDKNTLRRAFPAFLLDDYLTTALSDHPL